MSTKTPYGRTLFKFVAVPLVAPTVMFAQEALSPAGAARGAIERVPSQSVDAPGLKKSSEAKRMQVKRRADGALLAASSFETRSYSGSKLEAARSFLAEHRSLFGRVATNDLDHVNTRAVGSRTYVRFQQQLNGVPVRGAHLVVQVDSANRVKALTSRLEPSLNVDGAWTTDEETAIARALEGETGKLR